MKIFRLITCLFVLMFAGAGAQAATKIATLYTFTGSSTFYTQIEYHLDILTPEGVQHGVYKNATSMTKVGYLQEVSWTGSDTPPSLYLNYFNSTAKSSCPGLDDYDARSNTDWDCYQMPIDVYYDGELHGCPWLITTTNESYVLSESIGHYIGPQARNSTCPVSVATYDISWSEDYISYTKVLSLQSTGGMIEKTLPTFLMENGRLCDGSQMDDRGAYCRFVSQMITFSTSGCDSSSVTVTPNRHPITDKQLHDMVVQVDTSSRQLIDSTCRFQYTLNEL
ncbi:YfcO family protein [Escherichia coli]|uniref:StfH/YfcO family fimbrial adhesin n=1 Tax=Escherichia coli TaxID=562 RepID=UPI00200C991F|nr:StfH/YfcO family fimbrial adhesin [Escherichia coli]MCL0917947.1 YfcO family protein [Escherichia coli]